MSLQTKTDDIAKPLFLQGFGGEIQEIRAESVELGIMVFSGESGDMKKAKTVAEASELETIPNIGPAVARNLHQLGIHAPADLKGQDPYILYLLARTEN